MAIDVGDVFELNGVEPLFDEVSVNAVDDFCGLFCISDRHIKFRKADDLKRCFPTAVYKISPDFPSS